MLLVTVPTPILSEAKVLPAAPNTTHAERGRSDSAADVSRPLRLQAGGADI